MSGGLFPSCIQAQVESSDVLPVSSVTVNVTL
jgi:hypothetical protein